MPGRGADQTLTLKLRLARLLRERFGASSEKLRGEIEQLELLLGELEEQVAEAMPPEPDEAAAPPETETQRRKPVRKPLPATLPRDVVEHAAPCACPKCGGALRPLGEDVTEGTGLRAGLVPRHPPCAAEAVVPGLQVDRPGAGAQPADPSRPSQSCPLGARAGGEILRPPAVYRQAEIYARAGVELDRSTMADWVGQTARLMRPLVEAVGRHVMSAERVHGDDTTVPVLDPGRGKTKTGRLWCYARDDGPFGGKAPPAVLYCYSPDRKGEHPRAHLASFHGILQADGYAGYAGLYEHGVTEAACWAHARRNFFDVHAATQSPLALEALQRIAALYQIEAAIRGRPPDARLTARTAQSAPLFNALRQWLEKTQARIPGKSELAKAIRYTLSRWQALTLVLRDGRACIDNNAAERSMRPMVLGRKNWLFAGSDAGGERAAATYSLIETAKLSGLDPEDYLRQVLERIADHPVRRVHELLPWNVIDIHARFDQRNAA